MKKLILSAFSLLLSLAITAQITVTQADYGMAGDSIVVGYDDLPPAGLSVGGTGMQTWDFTSLSLSNINTLKFEDPANTESGSFFPNADLAIERLTDTIFFQSNATEFTIDGITGDGFGLGFPVRADFEPNSTQIKFPANMNDSYADTAIFDTLVDCNAVGFGAFCDSARLKRKLIGTSDIDAYGNIQTPGGSFNVLRQYFREFNQDSVWLKAPFVGWTLFTDSQSIVHNYRWIANGEDWPVLSAVVDAQNGNIISAEYKVGDQVLAFVDAEGNPSCNGACDGSASLYAVGGTPPYTYSWPGGQTTASASGLCAGQYVVTVSDVNNSTYEVTVDLTDPTPLSIAGAVQGVSVGGDGAIDITVSGGAGDYTYAWTGPNGFTASTADIADLEVGDYTVVATDLNNCDTSRTFVVDLTGIGNVDGSGYKLFPNPANESVTLQSRNRIQYLHVADLLGNVVFVGQPEQNMVTLNTSSYAPGIYIVEVETISGIFINKMTIKH